MYRVLFWVFFASTVFLIILGGAVLYSLERMPAYIFEALGKKTAETENTESFGDYAYLPPQYAENLARSPPPLSYQNNVKNLADFDEWRHDIISMLYGSALTVSNADMTEPESMTIEDAAGYTLRRLVIPASFDSEDVIFYELYPKEGARGAVFVIPGSGHQGARDVLGIPSEYSEYYYHDKIARRLLHEGYAVYTIEHRGYGERQVDVGGSCKNQSKITCSEVVLRTKMVAHGIDMHKLRLDEITQVLSYIESRDDTGMIAVAGLSLGAEYAASTAVINGDALDAVVLASGTTSVLYSPLNPDHDIRPDEIECCDSIDPIAAIAPTPLYVSFGLQESTSFRWEAETGHTGNFLSGVYEMHGAPENFEFVAYDGQHGYDIDSVIKFLDAHITSG